MKSETIHFTVCGAPLRAHLAHAEVLAILAADWGEADARRILDAALQKILSP